MFVKLDENKWNDLIPLLKENILENYFNILGLVSEKSVYKNIYVQYSKMEEIESILFLRNSGTIKFYAREGFNSFEVANFLKLINYKDFIGPASYCTLIQSTDLLTKSKKLTELCHLESKINLSLDYTNEIIPIRLEDVDRVIEVHKVSFKSFASKEVLNQRLKTKRGRAFGIIEDDKLVSVAGTDFETNEESLIVGVATVPGYRRRGHGTELVKYLSNLLQTEKKQVYLEYESPLAGSIYEKIGFHTVDSVYKYWD